MSPVCFKFSKTCIQILSICRRLQEAQAEHARTSASLDSAAEAAEASKAAAVERQKRFSLLNSQFKKREQALQKQLVEEREARDLVKEEIQRLASQQGSHEQACPSELRFLVFCPLYN